MYEQHFRLNAKAFSVIPDPSFIYWAEGHSFTYSMLSYGVSSRAPLTVITGEIGAGKTTLLHHLLQEAPQDLVVGLLSNILPDRGELLQWALMALDETPCEGPYVAQFNQLQQRIVDEYAKGRRVLLVIDEAQNLSVAQLEELRMLSNINAHKDELLQLILVGQPQLRETLNSPELTQFSQRIALDFHLEAMREAELEAYIQHRLEVAGATWRIFPTASCRLIHTATRGIPRLVNILCEMCLIYAFAADSKVVDEPLVREFLTQSTRRGLFKQFSPLQDAPVLASGW